MTCATGRADGAPHCYLPVYPPNTLNLSIFHSFCHRSIAHVAHFSPAASSPTLIGLLPVSRESSVTFVGTRDNVVYFASYSLARGCILNEFSHASPPRDHVVLIDRRCYLPESMTVYRGFDVSMGSISRTQEMMGTGDPIAPQRRIAL